MEFQLGQVLKDKVSGFKGIATNRTEFMTGNVQFQLQSKGGLLSRFSVGQLGTFDQHQLGFVKHGDVVSIESVRDTGIVLGAKVKDIVSGIIGIATQKVTFLNGCVYYTVVPPASEGSLEVKDVFIEYKRLATVNKGVTAALSKNIAILDPAASKSTKPANEVAVGGPAYAVPSRG